MSSIANETAEKTAAERRLFSMDFSGKMSTGETIESSSPAPVATSVTMCGGTSDLTIETPLIINSQAIEMWITGGTAGSRYKVTVTITTSTGQIIEGTGILKVT